ncbi:MAG: LPS-assembly protein LptD, partial [Pararhizobium sp.]
MDGQRHGRTATFRRALCAGVAACALAAVISGSTYAQTQPATARSGLPTGAASVPPGSKLLLSAQQLNYNDRTHVVVASGAVRIDYGGYKLVADQVQYNQDTHRMKANGHVELVSPDGTKTYAETMDVTDDFADGFVNALRIDTTDRTHIVATSAERRGGVETQFNNGVYTACEPCKKHPERAPFWQVKARKVVHDSSTKTIRLRNARMEMFGVPIGYFPYFSVPDQTVKRKSGFLRPSIGYSDALGAELRVPYYQVFSPYSDATFTGTGFSKQGFLGEAEFRQRFRNGIHTLTLAGIDQLDPSSFTPGSVDAEHSARGLVASRGLFQINPRWTVGWDLMAESDDNFGRTYGITGYAASTQTSQAFLTGLSGRNYFDLHSYYFDIQSSKEDNGLNFKNLEREQPFVLPVIDYQHLSELGGGQLTFTANETTLTRDRSQIITTDPLGRQLPVTRYQGLEGNDSRLSGELEWKRTFTTPSGLLLTPIAAARGDAFFVNTSDPSYPGDSSRDYAGDFAGDGTHARGMVTGGLEARYPILATAAHSTHVIEPIAQIFVRPDEPLAGGLPNEDAQSFVFDTSNLFSRDKFSGFDRVEGGTRANVGLQYTGSFDNGVTLESIFGQSYQIAGQNSFASPDLVY